MRKLTVFTERQRKDFLAIMPESIRVDFENAGDYSLMMCALKHAAAKNSTEHVTQIAEVATGLISGCNTADEFTQLLAGLCQRQTRDGYTGTNDLTALMNALCKAVDNNSFQDAAKIAALATLLISRCKTLEQVTKLLTGLSQQGTSLTPPIILGIDLILFDGLTLLKRALTNKSATTETKKIISNTIFYLLSKVPDNISYSIKQKIEEVFFNAKLKGCLKDYLQQEYDSDEDPNKKEFKKIIEGNSMLAQLIDAPLGFMSYVRTPEKTGTRIFCDGLLFKISVPTFTDMIRSKITQVFFSPRIPAEVAESRETAKVNTMMSEYQASVRNTGVVLEESIAACSSFISKENAYLVEVRNDVSGPVTRGITDDELFGPGAAAFFSKVSAVGVKTAPVASDSDLMVKLMAELSAVTVPTTDLPSVTANELVEERRLVTG